ncbi:MAG: hypothetical protein DSY37_02230 [Hyperthermus sp.]|nr:MAG: hypothetical protein DSY37_02230 [Hyperthermus sp.]
MSRGKRREKERDRHPCAAGWRVRWTREFRRAAQQLGIWDDVKRELRDLEKRLRDPALRGKALRLLRGNPVVVEIYVKKLRKWYPARRYYFGRQTARGFYVLREDICRLWFVALVPRTNGTYRRKKRRV